MILSIYKGITMFYVYGTIDGEANLVTAEPALPWMLEEDNLIWLYSLLAPTWNEAMADYHDLQGWEPYVPME